MSTFAQLLIQLTDALCGCFSEPNESHRSYSVHLKIFIVKHLAVYELKENCVPRLRSPLEFVWAPLILLSSFWSPLIKS